VRSKVVKRSIDLTAAAAGLLVAAPVLVAVAAAVRVGLGSPVLFKQTRPGLHGRPFGILKFRTMRDAKDANGTPLPDSERLTALGRFLRASSLDELPELFNVLKGDMSLVGPRPLLMEYLERYSAEQRRRHDVRPGITGWAQVNGRNAITWDEKLSFDCWYVDNWTNGLDLKILLSTVLTVLRREGIGHGGAETMPVFMGNDQGIRPPVETLRGTK
jgi:lipopolysaccharide/colanic/teichoic acid biosynthesis glycosyltransferase